MNYEEVAALTLDASERIAHRPRHIDNFRIVTECFERSALEEGAFRNAILPSVIGDHLNGGLCRPVPDEFSAGAAKRRLSKAVKNTVVSRFSGTIEWLGSGVHGKAQLGSTYIHSHGWQLCETNTRARASNIFFHALELFG